MLIVNRYVHVVSITVLLLLTLLFLILPPTTTAAAATTPAGPQLAPPTTSWSGPVGTEFVVNRTIGMVQPVDPPMAPAVETFSDVAFAPSQANTLSMLFANAAAQTGGVLTATQALHILRNVSTSGILPKQWSTMAVEQLRTLCTKYQDNNNGPSQENATINWAEMLAKEFPVAGADEHHAALKMQGIMRKKRASEKVREQRVVKAAYAKFVELDEDASGFLDGSELEILAEWVWSSFHPGGKPVPVHKREDLVKKLTQRVADAPNGQISFDAFEQWFRAIKVAMKKFAASQQKSLMLKEMTQRRK